MEFLAFIAIVAMTSAGAFAVGTRILALGRPALRPAISEALECIGLVVVFLVVNLAAGMALIFGLRALTGRFISIYWLNDLSLTVLSCFQALVFHCWRRATK